EMADLVGRLDKGAADIVVADDAELERQSRFLRIADRRRHARIRHRHDDIRIDMAFARQFPADALARLVDAVAIHHAVWPGEIDVLEDAKPLRLAGERLEAVQSLG